MSTNPASAVRPFTGIKKATRIMVALECATRRCSEKVTEQHATATIDAGDRPVGCFA